MSYLFDATILIGTKRVNLFLTGGTYYFSGIALYTCGGFGFMHLKKMCG